MTWPSSKQGTIISLLQDSYEDVKGLIMVPGTEYSLHKERFAFILKEISTGHPPPKTAWTQDPKLHNPFPYP